MGAYKTAVIADAPYWYYPADEASGTGLTDYSGSNRAGTITNTPTFNQQRLTQDTVRSIDWAQTGYGNAQSSSLLNSQGCTFECIFVPTDTTSAATRGLITMSSTSFIRLTTVAGPTTNISFRLKTSTWTSAATFQAGRLYHVALTYNVITGVFNLYVNGGTAETFTETAGNWTTATIPRLAYDVGTSTAFYGLAGHFAYWRVPLSAAQISAHYAALVNSTTSSVASTYSIGAAPSLDTSGLTSLSGTFDPTPQIDATLPALDTQTATLAFDPSAVGAPMVGITAASSFDVVQTGGYAPQIVTAAFKPDVTINPTRLKVTVPPVTPPVTVVPGTRKAPIIRTIRETYPTPTLVDGKPQ